MRTKISPALVVACVALAVALGGAGYAAVTLPAGSVGTKQLKKNAVTGAKVKNKSLRAADINQSTLAFGKVIKLDGLDFLPRNSATTVQGSGVGGGCVAVTAGSDYLTARLSLPEGARITKVVAYVYDNSGPDVVVELIRYSGKSTAGVTTLRSGSTTGMASMYRTVTYTGKPITVVRNAKYTYRLEVLLGNVGVAGHVLCGARVQFTVR